MINREYELYDYHYGQNSEKESPCNTISELQYNRFNDSSETTSEADREDEVRTV